MSGQYSPGWITVPGKGRRWRTGDGEYMMQRPAGSAPGVMDALKGAWSQADRALGGWLPGGGTAAPPTRAKQAKEREMVGLVNRALDRQSAGYVEPAGKFSKYGPIVNAVAATVDAGANPISVAMGSKPAIQKVSEYYQSNPDKPNQYDLSTNMFLRYLSGAGKEGLRLSPEQGQAILGSIKESEQKWSNPSESQWLGKELDAQWPGSGSRLKRGETPVYFGGPSDAPAPKRSTIPVDKGGRSELQNSLGSFWATPAQGGGYSVIDEKYDFGYAPVEKGGSEEGMKMAERQQSGIPTSMADIGRRLVMGGHGRPFSYTLDIDQGGKVRVR